ncbi:MAG: 50S ribosomal protein L35 [Bacteroidetes bacterium]|nr:MAG: 50S ribosomal protein L35 [Bacteroidota bacterium]
MPKMKSHRGARKTFTVTATGKVKRRKMNRRHILTSKVKKRKRQLRKSTLVSKPDTAKVKEMLLM